MKITNLEIMSLLPCLIAEKSVIIYGKEHISETNGIQTSGPPPSLHHWPLKKTLHSNTELHVIESLKIEI